MAAASIKLFPPAIELGTFDHATAAPLGKYDPGQIVVLFDHRHIKPAEDSTPVLTSYYLQGLTKMGWASYWSKPHLEPGNLRLVWYTHAGVQGHRDYPLYKAYTVKEMFDDLSSRAFRPMVIGFSAENPFPMIGGSEPPAPPKQPRVKVSSTASGTFSGHGGPKGSTAHDRVMAIIDKEDALEEEKRCQVAERQKKAEALGYADLTAAEKKTEEAGYGA